MNALKNFIVITTINEKMEGIRKFEAFNEWHVIIVGDKKTPKYESTDTLTYLSVEDQKGLGFTSADKLPYNHYTRKNIGYLFAISQGADVIYDTDDDNLPYSDWGFDDFICRNKLGTDSTYLNVYKFFTDLHIWPRGFPLDKITKDDIKTTQTHGVNIGVWQGLADNDPDVDAIYRLVIGDFLKFKKKHPVYLGKGNYCPFNSQNTLWNKTAFPLLYLPATVSFRFTDILRSYITQRLLWEKNFHIGFTNATVYQERNDHDLMKDFKDEVECYLNVKPIVKLINGMNFSGEFTTDIFNLYENLSHAGFVKHREIEVLNAWLNDYNNNIS